MEQNTNKPDQHIFSRLRGEWVLTRTVGHDGVMTGRAAFTDKPGASSSLLYTEQGINRLPGGEEFDFFQNYLYQSDDAGLHVFFADGRTFHTLDFETDRRAKARHLCGNDLYQGTYAFHDDDHFSVTWSVKGPKKDFVIQTKYNRQGSC